MSLGGGRGTALFYVEKDVVEDVQDVVFVIGQHLPAHPYQKRTKEYTLPLHSFTLMYSPKHRLLRDSLYSTFLALMPLSMKKCSRSRVVSIMVRGMS